ncbi:hypothetical protein L198_01470 [Cryptococcus wingfieldii CBS 7118]|uniref:Uncharacterized protein n=1 Tax=Cryptococcus wingfieldii CBS 7118 TaxID=1295528 RepID=A0A1E3JZC2_9TREE|nr:hypothetical protein L198_01470 [Cryptococcus wingfieldii CBS 7118]ODO06238.1 hypothetical protein L198_01470 [Cryptococcus wingfieldii CBS 7118]
MYSQKFTQYLLEKCTSQQTTAHAHLLTEFFVDTAKQHGLNVFSQEANDGAEEGGKGLLGEYNEVTRVYVDFLQAYLTAWQYAKTFHKELAAADPASLTQTQQALVKFVDNWTCDEFVEFVEGCAEIVDGAGMLGSRPGARWLRGVKRRCLRGASGWSSAFGLSYK